MAKCLHQFLKKINRNNLGEVILNGGTKPIILYRLNPTKRNALLEIYLEDENRDPQIKLYTELLPAEEHDNVKDRFNSLNYPKLVNRGILIFTRNKIEWRYFRSDGAAHPEGLLEGYEKQMFKEIINEYRKFNRENSTRFITEED